jgi:hypothetical protein
MIWKFSEVFVVLEFRIYKPCVSSLWDITTYDTSDQCLAPPSYYLPYSLNWLYSDLTKLLMEMLFSTFDMAAEAAIVEEV